MNVRRVEILLAELMSVPAKPLSQEQRSRAFEFAAGLFAGRLDGLEVASDMTMQQLQGVHALSHQQTFAVEYFQGDAGSEDAKRIGVAEPDIGALERALADVPRMEVVVSGDERKQIAGRSTDWARDQLTAQLARSAETDAVFQAPRYITVNYQPDKLLDKAMAVQAYRHFYRGALEALRAEPDQLLSEAERTLVNVYAGRLNAMAAVDVFPGLLALEDQLARSAPGGNVDGWAARLRRAAPALGRIHDLPGESRLQAREAYARHLDAIRQGAPLELDEVDGDEVSLFTVQVLRDVEALAKATSREEPEQHNLTELGRELQGLSWNATQLRDFFETVLHQWGLLSRHKTTWRQADDRDGFAEDGKFQVIVTPRRENMSVDSTRRIVNIPEDIVRPLVGLSPAGALPLAAHELSHVLQAYADYELGENIPLARIKGRRYRILREAGGVYQEKVLYRDYFGLARDANGHYVQAYTAKAEGRSRIEVARAFYDSVVGGRQLTPAEGSAVRVFAVNRTSRLYRYGGQNSQVLDYVEQSLVCDVLMQYMQPEQVDAFLLGSASFNLEDSAMLHRFGLLYLPDRSPVSPAHEVMRIFLERFKAV